MKKTRFSAIINEENLTISISIKNEGSLLANADVLIKTVDFGLINIKGYQIWKSNNMNKRLQESVNITPPSRKMHGRYIQLVYLENPDTWSALEARIYDAYCLARTRSEKADEIIDPHDIPL